MSPETDPNLVLYVWKQFSKHVCCTQDLVTLFGKDDTNRAALECLSPGIEGYLLSHCAVCTEGRSFSEPVSAKKRKESEYTQSNRGRGAIAGGSFGSHASTEQVSG